MSHARTIAETTRTPEAAAAAIHETIARVAPYLLNAPDYRKQAELLADTIGSLWRQAGVIPMSDFETQKRIMRHLPRTRRRTR